MTARVPSPNLKTAARNIVVEGASQGPLRALDLEIPLNKLVCFAGRSGSGSRTLAIDVLWAESRRRYSMALAPRDREKLAVTARAAVDRIVGLPPAMLVNGHRVAASDTVASFLQLDFLLSRLFVSAGELLCPRCGGLCVSFSTESAADSVIHGFPERRCHIIAPLEPAESIAMKGLLEQLVGAGFRRFWIGGEECLLEESVPEQLPAHESIAVVVDRMVPKGSERQRLIESINNARAISRGKTTLRDVDAEIDLLLNREPTCSDCGSVFHAPNAEDLLRPIPKDATSAAQYNVGGKTVDEVLRLSCAELRRFLGGIGDAEGLRERCDRLLAEMAAAGLSTMRPGMPSSQLSTTERMRLELVSCTTDGMAGLLYVCEYPTAGMDYEGVASLVPALGALVASGNSVIVVDNCHALLAGADRVIHFCEGANVESRIERSPRARTRSTAGSESKLMVSARAEPLFENVDVELPCQCLIGVCGPAASGKTFFLTEVLIPALSGTSKGARSAAVGDGTGKRRVVLVSPRSEAPRRTLLAEVGLSAHIGNLLASTPAAVERGYPAEWFQLESPGGRCSHCEGSGRLSYDLGIREEVVAVCPRCRGSRFKSEILEVTLRGANIGDLLSGTVDQCRVRFERDKRVRPRMDALVLCGLGHCKLGQRSAALEYGERVLLRLSVELGVARRRDFVVVTDTTGLDHPDDIDLLVRAADELVAKGATVCVETNNPAFLAEVDWRLEFGKRNSSGAAVIKSCAPR
jgi:excinuclease ABC subunit A